MSTSDSYKPFEYLLVTISHSAFTPIERGEGIVEQTRIQMIKSCFSRQLIDLLGLFFEKREFLSTCHVQFGNHSENIMNQPRMDTYQKAGEKLEPSASALHYRHVKQVIWHDAPKRCTNLGCSASYCKTIYVYSIITIRGNTVLLVLTSYQPLVMRE